MCSTVHSTSFFLLLEDERNMIVHNLDHRLLGYEPIPPYP